MHAQIGVLGIGWPISSPNTFMLDESRCPYKPEYETEIKYWKQNNECEKKAWEEREK
jgi:hypothetical protein